MSSTVYGFAIPHFDVQPSRDIVAIQIPYPPSKVRGLWIPDIARDLGSHGVQAGIIRAMGPLAFAYKDGSAEGVQRGAAKVGDWVLIKWGAGTMFSAARGVMNAVGGWRYISSFNDVIGVIPADKMPHPDSLEWSDEGVTDFADKPKEASVATEAIPEQVLTEDEIARRLGSLGTLGSHDARADGFGAPSIIGASGGTSRGSGHGRRS